MALVHPALLKSSGWTYSPRLRDLNAAQEWGCPDPGYFDKLDRETKIDLIAWYEAKWRIDAINSYEAQQEAERAAKKAARKKR